MHKRTEAEILAKANAIWPSNEWDHQKITVAAADNCVRITVARMYEPAGLSLANLMDLAEFFGTKAINDDDRFNNGGCETCDYGSSYGFTLTVRPEKVPA